MYIKVGMHTNSIGPICVFWNLVQHKPTNFTRQTIGGQSFIRLAEVLTQR